MNDTLNKPCQQEKPDGHTSTAQESLLSPAIIGLIALNVFLLAILVVGFGLLFLGFYRPIVTWIYGLFGL